MVQCHRCKTELRLLDPECSNGARFLCPQCLTRFSYFNGLIYEVNPPATKCDSPKSGGEGCFLVAVTVLITFFIVAIFYFFVQKSYNAKLEELERIESRFGAQSDEYLKAKLYILRNYLLKKEESIVAGHYKFLREMDAAGYMMHSPKYENNNLVSLVVRNVFDGREGCMNTLSSGGFNYPNWMSDNAARQIWKHYSNYENGTCESRLQDIQKEVADIESRL